ncbi:MAG: ornithine carbamoyltransferase [Methanomassiliicoccus sp.]|nr:ornithine carbamoyltransferase [Methanomassiliicoccus sp.]
MKRDVISVLDLREDIDDILSSALELKQGNDKSGQQLKGRTLGMIFEKSSTRTRVSFEVGMKQLGGHTVYLNQRDSQLGRGETVADTAKVLSRFVDGMVYRAFSHDNVMELARNSSVPVINALDDCEHPCQVMADLLTILEKKGRFVGLRLAYIGDGNNVCNSLALGAALVGMDFVAATPPEYRPDPELLIKAASIAFENDCISEVVMDPAEAAAGADIIYTDTWVSMGEEAEARHKESVLIPYQVNGELMALAKSDCIFMHCLPAHRGFEVTAGVIDGPQSVVFDQAENRMHAQKAILIKVMG